MCSGVFPEADLFSERTALRDIYRVGQKALPLRKLDFFQIKISPIFWTLMKIKVIPFDSLIVCDSNGMTFIFMSVQKAREILI